MILFILDTEALEEVLLTEEHVDLREGSSEAIQMRANLGPVGHESV
jgi:hypothetical protein